MVKLSPSKLDYLTLCPCYDGGAFTTSPAAERGTLLHLATETGDLSKVEPEDVQYVELCQAEQKALLDTAKQIAVSQGMTEVQEFKELKLEIVPGSNGIIDWMLIAGDTAFIVDWKFGEEPPLPAKDNWQLMSYAFAVFNKYLNVNEIRVGLFMPALMLNTVFTYKRIDLDDMKLKLISLRERVEDPNKVPTPCARACQWCAGKATCKALMAVATKVSGLQIPEQLDPVFLRKPEDLTAAMVLAAVLTDWASQVKSHCTKLAMEDAIETPGFEIRSRAGAKKIIDNVVASKVMADQGLSPDDVLGACSLSIARLADVFSAKKDMTKKAAKETILSKLEAVIVEKDRATWLQKEKGKTYEEIFQERLLSSGSDS